MSKEICKSSHYSTITKRTKKSTSTTTTPELTSLETSFPQKVLFLLQEARFINKLDFEIPYFLANVISLKKNFHLFYINLCIALTIYYLLFVVSVLSFLNLSVV